MTDKDALYTVASQIEDIGRDKNVKGWADLIEHAEYLRGLADRTEKSESELAALIDALRKPSEAVIDAPRSFLLGMNLGNTTTAKMRNHLRRSGVDYSMLPDWFQAGDRHITKAGQAICIFAFMTEQLLKEPRKS